MGDPGIVVISLTGAEGRDDTERWTEMLDEKPGAEILELRVRDETPAQQLEALSGLAEERGMSVRIRELSD
jgi:hypothetical protein